MNEIEMALQERFLLQKEYLGNNKPINQISPLVSVTVATYQHVNYIKECLDGILMQKTDFPYEIILGEDGSTDGTQQICKEYAEKFPDKIRLFIRDRRLSQYKGSDGRITRFNGIWNRMSCRGKYIAWCEGDDYWIDSCKLQKQVNFLETHSNYVLSHTSIRYYFQSKQTFIDSNDITINSRLIKQGIKFENILKDYKIQAVSVVFRRDLLDKIYNSDSFLYKSFYFPMGDTPLWYGYMKEGKIHFLPEITSVYRKNDASLTGTKDLKARFRFVLSSAELRLYLAMRDSLSADFLKYAEHRYAKNLLTYLSFVPDFTPYFSINVKKNVSFFMYYLYKSRLLKYYIVLKEFFARKLLVMRNV